MKRIFLLFFLLAGLNTFPALTFAQVTKKVKAKAKPKTNTPAKTITAANPAATEFVINATVTGFPDGTPVEFLNGQSGASEITSEVKGGKFTFKGKMERPDFKIILFNKQPPYITLFLDNSVVNIVGDKQLLTKQKFPVRHHTQHLISLIHPWNHINLFLQNRANTIRP